MRTLRAPSAAIALGLTVFAQPVSAQSARTTSGGFNGPSVAITVPSGSPDGLRFDRGPWPLPGRPGWPSGEDLDHDVRPDRPDRPGKPDRPRRYRHGWYGGGIGVIAGIERDRGYFSEASEAPEVVNGRAAYDYDRGYPYDYYAESGDEHDYLRPLRRDRSCETQWTSDRRSRQQVPVRICRN